jgi:hypothetical protein
MRPSKSSRSRWTPNKALGPCTNSSLQQTRLSRYLTPLPCNKPDLPIPSLTPGGQLAIPTHKINTKLKHKNFTQKTISCYTTTYCTPKQGIPLKLPVTPLKPPKHPTAPLTPSESPLPALTLQYSPAHQVISSHLPKRTILGQRRITDFFHQSKFKKRQISITPPTPCHPPTKSLHHHLLTYNITSSTNHSITAYATPPPIHDIQASWGHTLPIIDPSTTFRVILQNPNGLSLSY